MEGSTSKVTVTYWDPSSVFPLFAPDVKNRLPLKNLHWKSPSRPVRSINTLHVELNNAVPPTTSSGEDSSAISTTPSISINDVPTPTTSLARSNSNDSTSSYPSAKAKTKGASAIGRTSIGSSSSPNLVSGAGALKERRHQIPGLRQTPYLKIYFLRCDDNEYYRTTARKQLKEWIAEECSPTSSSTSGSGSGSSSKQSDNHDAFEWMIVHIVLPGTTAAAQPRLSGSSSATVNSSQEASKSSSRWQIKSNSTIMEKLKSDFGSSSKKVPSRFVQIRLSHPQPSPPPGAPTPTTPLPTPAEKEADYANLITHMKSLILTSFDLRVLQYEDDILSRSNQQHLPGWNFCTFFVLKEGLAGAFESVGLIEDAGAIYQELSVAGEAIIRNEEADREGGKTFLGWSGEVVKTLVEEGRRWHKHQAFKAAESLVKAAGLPEDITIDEFDDNTILSSHRKPYRELILSNNISVFDYLAYVYSRQASLLLRLAATVPKRSSSMPSHPATRESSFTFYDPTTIPPEEKAQDGIAPREGEAGYLADVVRKGIEFLRTGSAVLRAELYRGWESMQADLAQMQEAEAASVSNGEGKKDDASTPNAEDSTPTPEQDKFDLSLAQVKTFIDNYIASFVVNGVMQLLDATDHLSVPHLDRADLLLTEAKSPPPTPGITMGFKNIIGEPDKREGDLSQELLRGPVTIFSTDVIDDKKKNANVIPGTEDLAFVRAEALMLARGVVVEVAGDRWRASQEKLHPAAKPDSHTSKAAEMVEVSLADDENDRKKNEEEIKIDKDDWMWIWGIKEGMLRYALTSDDSFLAAYERMTETALKLFSLARRVKSTERTLAEIACIKYYQKDFSTAAHYLSKLTPSYTAQNWTLIEENLLMMYADCLKKMGRDDEFGKVVLILLKKQAEEEKRRLQFNRSSVVYINGLTVRDPNVEGGVGIPGMQEVSLLVAATELGVDEFWTDVEVDTFPDYLTADNEGEMRWSIAVNCRWLLDHQVTLDSAKLSITVFDEKTRGLAGVARDVDLVTDGQVSITRGVNRITFVSDMFYAATYEVLSLSISLGNLTFVHKFKPEPQVAADGVTPVPTRKVETPKVVPFNPPDWFHVKLHLPKQIQLDKVRTVEIQIDPGSTLLERVEMKVKSLTAGLRVLVADIQIINTGDTENEDAKIDVAEAGVIKLSSTTSDNQLKSVRLRVPYKSDGDLTELSLRLESHLTLTSRSSAPKVFSFVTTPIIPVSLPLSVNVQDIFTRAALFSKFQVSTVNHVPLRITSAKLQGSKAFKTATGVGCGDDIEAGVVVYSKQPAGFTFKTSRIAGGEEWASDNLYLVVAWRGVGEEVLLAVQGAFKRMLEEKGLVKYQRLLMLTLEVIIKGMEKSDVERAALLGVVKLPPFDADEWKETVLGISSRKGDRGRAFKAVEEFWEKGLRRRIPLLRVQAEAEDNTVKKSLEDITRIIVIPVDVPVLQCLATARLSLDLSAKIGKASGSGTQRMVNIGEVVKAKLQVGISRLWDLGKNKVELPKTLKFYYELSTTGDTSGSGGRSGQGREEWLVNGRRRGVFEYTFPDTTSMEDKDEVLEFDIALVPLKSGFLLLPGVEVRALACPPLKEGEDAITPSCETDYRSASEGVLVVQEVEERVLKMDEFGSIGRAMGRRPVSAGGD